jgi:DNA primase
MRFPQTFIDDLKRQTDIVRVIQDYVPLKKKGANWMACCPFHQEKTPSFSVNPSKEIFYCFGCGKKGNAFGFVMEMERVSFPEAIKIVAEKAGVPLPAMENSERFEAQRKEADEVIKLNSWALEWWEEKLNENGTEARAAREYIANRSITDETRKLFRLGYAPASWDALGNYLKSRGATETEIERSGLVVKKEKGGFYDRFRNRIVFPVLDVRGRPVAFGARAINPADEPKYLNSPETAAYTKGRHLYGLFQAREEIKRRRFVILVEGYLDLIVPFQAGVRNAVASLGTSLTLEQAKLLGRFARKVVINYDGDRAGVEAAKRAIQTLLAEDFEVKVLVLPDNADPDDFIKQHGAEEYQRRRGAATSHIQFVLDQALRDRHLERAEDKRAAVEEVIPALRVVKNPILKREYFDLSMDTLRIEPVLRRELWSTLSAAKTLSATERAARRHDTAREDETIKIEAAQPTVAEQQLLELLVHDAELRRQILPRLEASDYEELPTTAIFGFLKENVSAQLDFKELAEATAHDAIAADLVPILMMGEPAREEGEAIDDSFAQAERCVVALKLMAVERRQQTLAADIAAAARRNETERLQNLTMENLELTRRRNELMSLRF